MFCPSCGTEGTGLNYCNRCGANLTGPIASSVDAVQPINLTKPMLIIGAVALCITLGGFLMILSAATSLAMRTGSAGDLPMMIVFFGMLTILTLDILLMRQLSKLISAALAPERRAKEKQTASPQDTFRLPQPTTVRLEPGASVTDNTTRFFDAYPPASPEQLHVKKADY